MLEATTAYVIFEKRFMPSDTMLFVSEPCLTSEPEPLLMYSHAPNERASAS